MQVTVRIPTYLAAFADGRDTIVVHGAPATTSGVLHMLWGLHPGLRDRIVDEQGEVRQHINIFVGDECIRFAQGLATPVADGAEILIVPAVSGG
jgi:molybdopterin converting factor small subunit